MTDDPRYGERFAAVYDRLYPPGDAQPAVDRLARLHPGDGSPTLELGVGNGRVALPLADRVGRVVGVDAAPEMLDALRAKLAATPRPVEPVLGDIREHRDEGGYGLVYCVLGTISMVLDPAGQAAVLRAMARAGRPGAAVVVETHNPAWVHALHDGRPTAWTFTPHAARDSGLLMQSILLPDGLWRVDELIIDDGRVRVAQETSRLTTPAELDAHAGAAGLVHESTHADWAGTAQADGSPMTVSVYRVGT